MQIFNIINKFHYNQNEYIEGKKPIFFEEKIDLKEMLKYLQNKYESKEINTIDYKLGKLLVKFIQNENH